MASLNADVERELLSRWTQDRDMSARARLVESQQALVMRLASSHSGPSHPIADLVQEGNLGLLRALDRFDAKRAVRLATYATWWIRAYMLRFVEHNQGLVRGATTAGRTRLFYQLGRTRQRLAAEGEEPSREAVAHALGVSEADVEAMELLASPPTSLDTEVSSGDRTSSSRRIDSVVDRGPTPEQALGHVQMSARLDRALEHFGSALHGREREMFTRRVSCAQPASLRELGQRFGMTRAAVGRLETQVARPLRRFLYRELGDSITAVLGHA